MGRTNMILLGMGIVACVVLSLLMQRGIKLQKAASVDPVARAVTEVFGTRLQEEPRFRVDTRGDRRVAVLRLVPRLPSTAQRLAKSVGRFVWQQQPALFDELVIVCKGAEPDQDQEIPIPRPFLPRSTTSRPSR
ncbi:MAG: hypothetical protein ACYTF5_17220 [Planctomycetota bacterium]|jgi:hypothetical protein